MYASLSIHHPHAIHATLYNRLQLPRVAQRILNDRIATAHDVLPRGQHLRLLLREVYAAILRHPAARLRELDDRAFRVEEQQVLGVADLKGRVGALGAGGDFRADGVDEDLVPKTLVYASSRAVTTPCGGCWRGGLTSLNTANSSLGTRSPFVSPHTLS